VAEVRVPGEPLPRYRLFWEHYLCYVVRGKVMNFEFEALE
jgi:hypothetical protein